MPRVAPFRIFEATLAVVVWGGSFVATKVALRDVAPATLVWVRFAMGVVILGGTVLARRQFAWPTRKELLYFALLGFIGITLHQWLQSTALVTAQASNTAWIVATTPVFIALMGAVFLKEKLGLSRWLGIGLASAGVLVVVSGGDWRALGELGSFGTFGDWLILISAVNWGVFAVLSRSGLQRHPATRMMFYVMATGWVFSTGMFVAGPGPAELAHVTAGGWLAVGFLGVFASGVAYIFWYDALQVMPAAQAGVFLYLEPLVTVVVAAMVLQEAVTWASLGGGGVILLGVWLVNRSA